MGRNLSFNLQTILSQVFTLSFPFFTLSTCALFLHNQACPFSFRHETFTLLGSCIFSISKYVSISLIQSIKSQGFRILEYVGMSILAFPLISISHFKILLSGFSASSSPSASTSSSISSSLGLRVSIAYTRYWASLTHSLVFSSVVRILQTSHGR